MNRQEKEQVITSLKNELAQSTASFLVGYRGLTVSQLSTLRKRLRKAGGTLQVAKVTLMRRAVHEDDRAKALDELFGDQTALVFAHQEPPAVAQVLCNFAKEFEQLTIVGGCFEKTLLTTDAVKTFALLPPRAVLLAQVCGTLQAPMGAFVGVLHAIIARLLLTLKEIEHKK